jgi:hypothetical protein
MQNPVIWITGANAIYLVSYAVRDILWLRVLTVVAAALLIPYYSMQAVPLRAAIEWNIIFIAINCYWVIRLIIERRFVGTLDLQADVLSELDVVTRTASRVMCWRRETLTAFTARRPDVKLALERSVGFELQRILGTTLATLHPRG